MRKLLLGLGVVALLVLVSLVVRSQWSGRLDPPAGPDGADGGGAVSKAAKGPGTTDTAAQRLEERYPDGSIKLVHSVLRTGAGRVVEHGLWTLSHQGGKKAGEGRYMMGVKVGVWRWWRPDGMPREETTWSSEETGVCTKVFFHPNGKKAELGRYADDTREGPIVWWHENGNKAAEETYTRGVLDGPVRHWHENGRLSEEGRYAAGQPIGTVTYYHENGQKAEEGGFENGLQHGVWREWDAQGQEIRVSHFVNGKSAD